MKAEASGSVTASKAVGKGWEEGGRGGVRVHLPIHRVMLPSDTANYQGPFASSDILQKRIWFQYTSSVAFNPARSKTLPDPASPLTPIEDLVGGSGIAEGFSSVLILPLLWKILNFFAKSLKHDQIHS